MLATTAPLTAKLYALQSLNSR